MTLCPQTTLWKTQSGEKVRMCDLDTPHLIASINWQIRHRGHKHTKLERLITEAYRRLGEGVRNKIPATHKWVAPTLERLTDMATDTLTPAQRDAMLDKIHEIEILPETTPTQDCDNCSGTSIFKDNTWTCLNCGTVKSAE